MELYDLLERFGEQKLLFTYISTLVMYIYRVLVYVLYIHMYVEE